MVTNDNTSESGDDEYVNAIWDGTLPAPTGKLAREFEKVNIEDQKTLTSSVYQFLLEADSSLTQLNSENRLYTALINVPHSNIIRVIYGLGYGSSGIGETSPIDNTILAMSGEGDATLGVPPTITLPSSARNIVTLRTPTDAELQEALTKTKTSWHRFKRNNISENSVSEVLKIAPIPAFLVYDGFNKDLSAEEIYERVLSLEDQEEESITHCRNFLRACCVSRNLPDPKQFCAIDSFLSPQTVEARNWATSKFKLLVPTLTKADASNTQHQPTNKTTELEDILSRLAPTLAAAPKQPANEIKPEDKFGMSPTELKSTLAMCGLREGEEDLLPDWLVTTNEKGQNDNTRNQIIIATLKNILFEDAEIPVTAPLLLMIRKRKWLSDDPTATYRTAAKGLSIFAVAPLTEDEVALINDTMEALEQATTTTAKEYKDVTRIKAKIPEDSHDFLLLIKTFANLLYALFGSSCPLYLHVRKMIKAFTAYTRTALKAMSMATKASVLWITLLQTRHFAGGNLTTLAEFQNMMDKITAKESVITHAEVPAAFLTPKSSKRKSEEITNPKDPTTPPRKQLNFTPPPVTPSPDRPTRVHPVLREKLVNNVIRKNPHMSLTKIAKYCNTTLSALCKDTSKCVVGFLGMCNSRYCRRRHMVASDAEADHMIMQLEKAISDPEGLKTFEG
jgi:hypothetical protein